jgi:hypothetical protein
MMAGASSQSPVKVQEQKFDYFLVLDFEATCDNSCRINPQVINIIVSIRPSNMIIIFPSSISY